MLKDALEEVNLDRYNRVEGNFMDLAVFPHLRRVDADVCRRSNKKWKGGLESKVVPDIILMD